MPTHLPYGSWPSTITASAVAGSTTPLGGACFYGENIIVQEGRPLEGGRITLVKYGANGETEELILAPI